MKTWLLDGPKTLRLVESEPTLLKDNMVKVKIEQELFTSSDYAIYLGENKRNYPFVLGRCAMGVISEVFNKDKSMLKKMDRVAIEPYVPCEKCEECKKGDYGNCTELQELGLNTNGLLQNFIDLPHTLLHRLPDNLSNEKALFVSNVSFCLNICDALKMEKGRHIAIFSNTKTGLILAQLVAHYQAVPIFCSNREELIAEARNMGVFYSFNTDNVDIEKELLIVTGGRMCKELVLFADSDLKMKDVYNSAAHHATICLAGCSSKDSKLTVAQICKKRLNVFGVYNGVGNFSSAINLLVTNTINVDNLIGEQINFDNLPEELEKVDREQLVLKSKVVKIN